jgi:hypothetical protein|tara:strand:- start:2160 stop:2348 length:189 start_codon:yes stop_codon:yes gene_type:complete
MNNAPPVLREQCQHLLEWMQNRSDELAEDKQFDDMFALYMEWNDWIEQDNPTLLALVKDEDL